MNTIIHSGAYVYNFLIDDHKIDLVDRKIHMASWFYEYFFIVLLAAAELIYTFILGVDIVMNESDNSGYFLIVINGIGFLLFSFIIIGSFFSRLDLEISDGYIEIRQSMFNWVVTYKREKISFIQIEKIKNCYYLLARYGYALEKRISIIPLGNNYDAFQKIKPLINFLRERFEFENNSPFKV